MNKLVKFGADWCAACRTMDQILDDIKETILIVNIDVDEIDPIVLANYKIRHIPVLQIQDNLGNVLWQHVGTITKDKLIDKIKEYETSKAEL